MAERQAPGSGHTVDNPTPTPPMLLRAAVLLTRASARMAEASTALQQAHQDIEAARAGLPEGALWEHNTLRAAVVVRLLEARAASERIPELARQAEQLAAPRGHAAREGGPGLPKFCAVWHPKLPRLCSLPHGHAEEDHEASNGVGVHPLRWRRQPEEKQQAENTNNNRPKSPNPNPTNTKGGAL